LPRRQADQGKREVRAVQGSVNPGYGFQPSRKINQKGGWSKGRVIRENEGGAHSI